MIFRVAYEDGTSVEVRPGPADVLAFEKEHDTTLAAAIRSGSPLWSIWLCWHKLHRRGEGRPFDAWVDQVETIRDPAADDEGGSDPTDGAPASAESAPAD